ncbi:MAG: threonine synthase [Vagococcus sp.]|uniref:threonine synthase n=1 Tax=Vagococcus sp. TaxID=1933889 RepID=UPI002FC85AD0
MNMMYQSTRNKEEQVTASQAILKGLASDGGLFVPVDIPKVDIKEVGFFNQTYQELAYKIMQPFLSDFTEEELKECINRAYDDKFTNEKIAPLRKVGEDYYLELYHGSTLAFKDMALSILPYLMTTAVKKQKIDNEIVILTATSGDTGKAAMEGFSDVEGTKIIVFYPKDGVSDIQEKQMVTQKGNNTFVVGINGNFDDAQKAVKDMFENDKLNKELASKNKQFSSANSINIGRLVPQIVYYFYAYQQLIESKEISLGELINVSVPTGNFGNILAAFYAKQMGLPIDYLICASNKNNVLTDFFSSGHYSRNRDFYVTNSPSMDILVSSNLERLLYEITNKDTNRLNGLMTDLKQRGEYSLDPVEFKRLDGFFAGFTEEEKIETIVKAVFEQTKEVIDPHTAVAKKVADEFDKNQNKTVIVSTASPFKFPRVFTGEVEAGSEIKALHEISQLPIPKVISELEDLEIRHHHVVELSEMEDKVLEFLR